ncbi:MAG: hypothetical protein Q8932_19060, partial [Bacteroidota bacterium]|nr:hypothetical protein [Bacteroidota bacterium]
SGKYSKCKCANTKSKLVGRPARVVRPGTIRRRSLIFEVIQMLKEGMVDHFDTAGLCDGL